jgi:opacity protein-like surface antigen
MKKLILSAFALCAFTAVSAQDNLTYGVKAAVNFSNLSGVKNPENGKDADGKTGFAFGAFADYAVNDKFHVQAEALYSMEGADKYKLDYLRIPVLAKYYVMDKLAIMAGPSFGFKIADETNSEKTKSMDLGLAAGAAYDVTENIFVDLRYTAGMSDIKDTSGGDAVKTTNFQIGVGYKF